MPDALDEGIIGRGPPELFVMVDSAEDGVVGKGEHEVAAVEIIEEGLKESLKLGSFSRLELDR